MAGVGRLAVSPFGSCRALVELILTVPLSASKLISPVKLSIVLPLNLKLPVSIFSPVIVV